jgi:addiction module HigA family antidote
MTKVNNKLKIKLAGVHPGEIVREEFMKPLGLSQTRLGRDLGVSPRRINEIVHGKRSVTADTALRLSRYFGTSAEFWLGIQTDYDLDTASDRLAERIDREVILFVRYQWLILFNKGLLMKRIS